jgi:hypothetical protein
MYITDSYQTWYIEVIWYAEYIAHTLGVLSLSCTSDRKSNFLNSVKAFDDETLKQGGIDSGW